VAGAPPLRAGAGPPPTAMAPLELPVGIVTAIVGGPVFLWLLFRRA
jgi:ABC-type cobalamin transport system permease subunit